MGRGVSGERNENPTEVEVVDRGINSFAQLNLNCKFFFE